MSWWRHPPQISQQPRLACLRVTWRDRSHRRPSRSMRDVVTDSAAPGRLRFDPIPTCKSCLSSWAFVIHHTTYSVYMVLLQEWGSWYHPIHSMWTADGRQSHKGVNNVDTLMRLLHRRRRLFRRDSFSTDDPYCGVSLTADVTYCSISLSTDATYRGVSPS